MGASKRDFVSLRMSLEDYKNVPTEHLINMQIKSVYPEGWDEIYKLDSLWLDKKEASKKAYRELKEREEEIRNNKK